MSADPAAQPKPNRPPHPFWCDDCGERAGFRIKGCPIPHRADCPRHGEEAEQVFNNAVAWCRVTGGTIP
jgi:hypothetical protein